MKNREAHEDKKYGSNGVFPRIPGSLNMSVQDDWVFWFFFKSKADRMANLEKAYAAYALKNKAEWKN